MQLASHGVRALPARVSQRLSGAQAPGSSRAIHTPSFLRAPQSRQTRVATAKKLVYQAKNLFGRFVTHLTTPGQLGPRSNVSNLARFGRSSIQQGYSLPVRHALSRPFSAFSLIRPPNIPRNVVQVGLGTVRNFHSTRPIFQNIVGNVPVVGRAFCEADFGFKMKGEKQKARSSKKSRSKERKLKDMIKSVEKRIVMGSVDAEFDKYFAPAFPPGIVTHLLVPLAPTPTTRNPLPATSSPSYLPMSVLLDIHSSYELHSLRVSSLFARLDVSQVWTNPEVSCTSYGDPSGLATILKIEFRGWSEAEVRAVIGEAGRGWCVLEEIDELDDSQRSPTLSGISTPLSGIEEDNPQLPDFDIDPSNSLVIPSLDLSNYEAWSDVPSMPAPLLLPSRDHPHPVVLDYDSDGSLHFYDQMDSGSDGWMAMSVSSMVSDDDEDEEGPRGYMMF